MKKLIFLLALAAFCCFFLCACEKYEPDEACISFLRDSAVAHYSSEISPSGHVCSFAEPEIIYARQAGNETTVYAWIFFSNYVCDENGVSPDSGSFIPCAVSFMNENGRYTLTDYREPRDGDLYAGDIRRIFPFFTWKIILKEDHTGISSDLQKKCDEKAQTYYDEIAASGGLEVSEFEEFDPKSAVPFSPSDIRKIRHAEILEDFGDFAISDPEKCRALEELLSSAETLRGETNCPFGIKIYLFREDGKIGYVRHAEDGCQIFCSGKNFYRYSLSGEDDLWSLFGIVPESTDIEYDENGNLLRQTDYSWYSPTTVTEYTYDEAGNILLKSISSPESDTVSETEYSYSDEGLLSEEKTFSRKQDSVETAPSPSPDSVISYTYDEKGNRIKSELFDAKGRSVRTFEYEFDENGNCTRLTYKNGSYDTYRYDSSGTLLEVISYNQFKVRLRRTEYRYNERGDLERKILYNVYGEIQSSEVFRYDEDGNLVRISTYDGKGNYVSGKLMS